MRIMLGDKIKELRKRDGRTQDDLATALGITNQAVSRWEANKAYPDMEIIPAIANYFHVSIDELFGYSNDRERRLAAYIEKADSFFKIEVFPPTDKKAFKKHELFLRQALSEFPNEWHLQERLAQALWMMPDSNWEEKQDEAIAKEACSLMEQAYKNCDDVQKKDSILRSFIDALCRLGDYKKIEEIAMHNSPIYNSREIVRTKLFEENKESRYTNEAFLALLHELTEIVNSGFNHFSTTNNPDIYLSITGLYKSVFEGGNYDWFNSDMCMLYLNASRIYNRNNDFAHAIEYFGKAYDHGLAFQDATKNKLEKITAPLLNNVVDFPSRFVFVSESTFKEYLELFSEEVISKLRSNPKYAAII